MQLGRYEVVRSLGEGGSAKVLLGKALATDQHVVLKVPLQISPDQNERLRDEARVGLRLSHPNIVDTLDMFEHEGKPILVVEYVDGASLQQIRRVGPLTPPAVVRLGRQVAGALAAIHEATDEHGAALNILHRDVTPGNILINRAGDAKLIDLGIARSAETQARATQAGAVRGTLRYLAPELIEGKRHSAATDLWALGVVLWESVLGRRAIVGDDREILTKILRGDVMVYQPGEALDPRLHDAIAALISPESARIQKAKAAANIFARLEAAFGDGQAPAVSAVDVATRLAPEPEGPAIGDVTRQIIAERPNPITLPPTDPDNDAPSGARAHVAPDDSMEDGAPTIQMQAADVPRPHSVGDAPAITSPPPEKAMPAEPTERVAPVSSQDLSDVIGGRYAATQQQMPAVNVAPPAAVAPLDEGAKTELSMPAVDAVNAYAQTVQSRKPLGEPEKPANPPPAGPPKAPAPQPRPAPPVAAAPGAAFRPPGADPAARPPDPSAISTPETPVHGLGVNEETEAAFDNPFDELSGPSGGGEAAASVKSTQLIHGGLAGQSATEQAMPAIDATALDPALQPTIPAPQQPILADPPSAPTGPGPLPSPPPAAPPPQPPAAAAAPRPPSPAPAPARSTAPPQAAGGAPPKTTAPQGTPPVAAPAAIPQPRPAARVDAPLAAPPLAAAPPAAAPPAAAPPAAAPPAAAPPAAAPPPAAPPPAAPPPAAPAPTPSPAPAKPASQQPTPANPRPAATPQPARPAPSQPGFGSAQGGMTVTQAFFTKDIQRAMTADPGGDDPPTHELEAAIAPVEGRIALVIGGIALLVILLGVGGYALFGGGDEAPAGDTPTGASGAPDAGSSPDAGAPAKEPVVEKKPPTKPAKSRKRRGKRRGKRRR